MSRMADVNQKIRMLSMFRLNPDRFLPMLLTAVAGATVTVVLYIKDVKVLMRMIRKKEGL